MTSPSHLLIFGWKKALDKVACFYHLNTEEAEERGPPVGLQGQSEYHSDILSEKQIKGPHAVYSQRRTLRLMSLAVNCSWGDSFSSLKMLLQWFVRNMSCADAGMRLNPMCSQLPLTMWANYQVTLPHFSVAGKHCPKARWRKKGFIWLAGYSSPSREGKSLEAGTERDHGGTLCTCLLPGLC